MPTIEPIPSSLDRRPVAARLHKDAVIAGLAPRFDIGTHKTPAGATTGARLGEGSDRTGLREAS